MEPPRHMAPRMRATKTWKRGVERIFGPARDLTLPHIYVILHYSRWVDEWVISKWDNYRAKPTDDNPRRQPQARCTEKIPDEIPNDNPRRVPQSTTSRRQPQASTSECNLQTTTPDEYLRVQPPDNNPRRVPKSATSRWQPQTSTSECNPRKQPQTSTSDWNPRRQPKTRKIPHENPPSDWTHLISSQYDLQVKGHPQKDNNPSLNCSLIIHANCMVHNLFWYLF